MTELLSGGAVQVEVDGVVSVHEQLGYGPRQFKARCGQCVGSASATEERGGNRDQRQRKSCDEERKRDGQQHDGQSSAALL